MLGDECAVGRRLGSLGDERGANASSGVETKVSFIARLCVGGRAPGASIPQVAIPLRTPAPPAPRSRDNTEKLNAQLSAANR